MSPRYSPGGGGRLVYSTGSGRACPRCSRPVARCSCKKEPAVAASDGIVRVRREKRRGKPVTVILGAPVTAAELKALARDLKRLCGSGGTAKAGAIEIQGDHREVVMQSLTERGWTVKAAGG